MNTHINKNRTQPTHERRFTGITVTAANYRELLEKGGRHEMNYHSRHLEAYLAGKEVFKHGFRYDEKGKVLGPKFYRVMQELVPIS
jgi:hypothetical protein